MDIEKDALGGQAPAKPGRVSRKPKEDSLSPGRQRRTRKPETEREADNKGGDFFSSDLPKKLALLVVITLPLETGASVSLGACAAKCNPEWRQQQHYHPHKFINWSALA